MLNGSVAHLGERLHGMEEVAGSIPVGSTIFVNDSRYNKVSAFFTQINHSLLLESQLLMD